MYYTHRHACLYPDFHNVLVFLASQTQYLHPSHSASLLAAASACLLAVEPVCNATVPFLNPQLGLAPEGQT